MSAIQTIDDYFAAYGKFHVQKSTTLLDPLHVPHRDPLPDFDRYARQPFEAQAHVVAALVKTLDAQHSAILAAEMGTGKTMMGMLAADVHARRSGRRGGSRGRYRGLVLCPDHLIMKWKDEIQRTIPDAQVMTFDLEGDGCKQLVKDMTALYTRLRGSNGRWRRPEGPEWYILGRDQSKLMCGVSALGSRRRGPDGCGFEHGSSFRRIVRGKDEHGKPTRDVVRIYRCPRCGGELIAKGGEKALDIADSNRMLNCGHRYAVEIPDPARKTDGLERWSNASMQKLKEGTILTRSSYDEAAKKFRVHICGEPLWQYVAQPRRWAPALFLAKKMPKLFDYLIADEIHQQKAKTTAQANAFGMLASEAKNVLCLTGTLVGGYARDLFYLLLRTDARPLLAEGFGWGKDLPFTREYGRIETIETTRTTAEGHSTISRSRKSLAKTEETKEDERPAPGVMPALFGRHLIGRSVFLSLDDLAANLPRLREYVGGPAPDRNDPDSDWTDDDHDFWRECCLDMEPAQAEEYRRVESILSATCTDLLQHGSMKLLGGLLVATLGYSDMPFGWKPPTGRDDQLACGYWDKPKLRTADNWVGVVQPRDLPQDIVYPKEQALLDIVEKEVLAGNQVWVYVQMSDKRDVRTRLAKLLRDRGYEVAILKSGGKGGPKPKDRLAWIEENGRKVNVIISHPQLVETGIDFFKQEGEGYSHNFNSIVFYQTGYNIFTLRQAARRAWRIGQSRGCRIYYLYYRGTGQERAMKLIAKKMDAALSLDGEFSVEGLGAMVDEQSAAMMLARSISEHIDDTDIARNWTKVGTRPPAPAAIAGRALGPIPGLDILSMGADLISQTLLDHDADSPTITPDQLAAIYDEFFADDFTDEDFDFDADELLAACR